MTNKSIIILVLTVLGFSLQAQLDKQIENAVSATRIQEKIILDGKLDEVAWKAAKVYSNFKNVSPNPGLDAEQVTEVKVIYDDNAIYIGAKMLEQDVSNINQQITERDDTGQADWFIAIFDTYRNGTNGTGFLVTPSGTQVDIQYTSEDEDDEWDEVWENASYLADDGWYCEIKVPYSALRFPKEEVQKWNINFRRFQSIKGQQTSLFPHDPQGPNFLTQMCNLEGVKDIEPPVRLAISPYISGYLLHSKDNERDPVTSVGASYNAGLDLKYGISDAFTLQSTLIPDFGQVRSDDQVLNLSPFEVRFDENRAFFTEGTEIFSKANLFYSRRIGGLPIGFHSAFDQAGEDEHVTVNPQQTQLYNATKVSGRAKSGTGIGFFNAVEGSSYATIESLDGLHARQVKTAPLTNYNVFVIDQNLQNNSSLAFINTNVTRVGSEFKEANVTGTQFDFKNKKQNYSISGSGAYSTIFGNNESLNGHRYNADIGKIAGNFRYSAGIEFISPDYNINDLGINFETNQRNYGLFAAYSIYKPFLVFNRANFWSNFNHSRSFAGNRFASNHFNWGFWTQTKKQWSINMWFNYRPIWYDLFEPRVFGRVLQNPAFNNGGFYINTDRRKRLSIGLFGFLSNSHEKDRNYYEYGLNPYWRVNDKWNISMDFSFSQANRSVGQVDMIEDDIIMGQRNQSTIINSLYTEYNFSKSLNISLRGRHYWSTVYYLDFLSLNEDGTLSPSSYDENNDFNFNVFNIDLNLRWRFAPGSDLFLVWKNNIVGAKFAENLDYRELNYSSGLNELRQEPQNNSLSLRLVYFLDYNRTVQALKK